MLTSVAADSDQLSTQGTGGAHASRRKRSLVPHGGEEWVTITSSLRSDMTAAGQWSDKHSLPRSDKRHPAPLRSSHLAAPFKAVP
jgi:hypothetical protein